MKAIWKDVEAASGYFGVPAKLVAAVLQTENTSTSDVKTWLQRQETIRDTNYNRLTWKPNKDKQGATHGLANFAPGTVEDVVTRIHLNLPDLAQGKSFIQKTALDEKGEILSAINNDKTAIYLLAGNLKAFMKINAGQKIAGRNLPSNPYAMTNEELAFHAKYHNSPGFKGTGHWAQTATLKLMNDHDAGAKALKFLPLKPRYIPEQKFYVQNRSNSLVAVSALSGTSGGNNSQRYSNTSGNLLS